MELFLMSPPPPSWALRGRANFRSAQAPPVDPHAARREWVALALAIEEHGGTVIALPSPDPSLTGLPYAAECGQVVTAEDGNHAFLLPRMAHPHRRPEARHWEGVARRLGLTPIELGRGLWEAQGDVASFAGVTLLFHGGRTDREGLEAALGHFAGETLVLQVREPAFHGNMALLPLPAIDRLLVCPEVLVGDGLARLEARFGAERLVSVSEEEIRSYATNGLPVGRTWLAPDLVPERVARLLGDAGMEVLLLPMPELCGKGGGASRCLVSHASLPDGAVELPESLRLPTVILEMQAGRA